MSSLVENATIKIRRDTAANWESNNPALAQAELGYDLDSGLFKIGDGSTTWSSLEYYMHSVGRIQKFATYKDRSSKRLEPFAFNNAVSTSGTYSMLWDEIQHMYNQQHVDAGDADLSGSSTLFYPTPIPGKYGRSGIPDEIVTEANFSGDNIINISNSFELGAQRPGTPIKFVVESGTLPSPLVEGTVYYINAGGLGNGSIGLHNTEAEAISGTSKITYTGGSGTFRLTQEGVGIGDAIEEHEHNVRVNTPPNTDGVAGVRGTTSQSDQDVVGPDSLSGVINANVSNETRPDTAYEFGYITY